MKRLFFIVILLLATVFKGISAYPIYKGKIIRGDLHFYIDYTDTLKQEVEKYRVWYEPKEYSDYFNGKEYISELSVYMNGIDFGNLLAGVEYLAISCFGEEKVFNKEGEPNIYRRVCYRQGKGGGKRASFDPGLTFMSLKNTSKDRRMGGGVER